MPFGDNEQGDLADVRRTLGHEPVLMGVEGEDLLPLTEGGGRLDDAATAL
jgi:hypothetical protein